MATLTNSSGSTYTISVGMNCADNYHIGTKHTFKGTEKEVDKLLFIIEKLNLCTKLERKDAFSFVFESKDNKIQKFIFKICRYIRNSAMEGILDTAIECINAGVKPYNALLIGHFYKKTIEYYRASNDILPLSTSNNYAYTGFYKEEDFIKKVTYSDYINNIYESESRFSDSKVREYLKEKQYKEASNYLLPILK